MSTQNRILLMVTAFVMILIAILGIRPTSASGSVSQFPYPPPGCYSARDYRYDGWTQTETAAIAIGVGAGYHIIGKPVKMTVLSYYAFCSNYPHAARGAIAQVKFVACWNLPDGGSHRMFDGVRFTVGGFDEEGRKSGPFTFTVGDDGTDGNCKTFIVPKNDRKWLQIERHVAGHAKWTVSTVTKRNGSMGLLDEGSVKWSPRQGLGLKGRYYFPENAPVVGKRVA